MSEEWGKGWRHGWTWGCITTGVALILLYLFTS